MNNNSTSYIGCIMCCIFGFQFTQDSHKKEKNYFVLQHSQKHGLDLLRIQSGASLLLKSQDDSTTVWGVKSSSTFCEGNWSQKLKASFDGCGCCFFLTIVLCGVK